jgi:hypothetical protein
MSPFIRDSLGWGLFTAIAVAADFLIIGATSANAILTALVIWAALSIAVSVGWSLTRGRREQALAEPEPRLSTKLLVVVGVIAVWAVFEGVAAFAKQPAYVLGLLAALGGSLLAMAYYQWWA